MRYSMFDLIFREKKLSFSRLVGVFRFARGLLTALRLAVTLSALHDLNTVSSLAIGVGVRRLVRTSRV